MLTCLCAFSNIVAQRIRRLQLDSVPAGLDVQGDISMHAVIFVSKFMP